MKHVLQLVLALLCATPAVAGVRDDIRNVMHTTDALGGDAQVAETLDRSYSSGLPVRMV